MIAAAVLSPGPLAVIPAVLLAWRLFLWLRPVSAAVSLFTNLFLFLAVAALFSEILPPYLAVLLPLPLLLTIHDGLLKSAPKITFRFSGSGVRLTPLALSAGGAVLGSLIISAILGNTVLTIAADILILFLLVLLFLTWLDFPEKAVECKTQQVRILAGRKEIIKIKMSPRGRRGGRLFISTSQEWVKVLTPVLPLQHPEITLEIALTPGLSGPAGVKLEVYAIDSLGLLQARFQLEPVEVLVIPRARYARWLVQKYLSGTGSGSLPVISIFSPAGGNRGLRQGIEYYGSRLYQPGDSLKNIDWKHSCKYNELITMEFSEFQGKPAILLVNLVAGNTDEADRLAYNIIVAALSLGRENIPAAMAVYNRDRVVYVTGTLSSQQLLMHSMRIVKDIVILPFPTRYLETANILRLQANIRRIEQIDGAPASVLKHLLQAEYSNLKQVALRNPCSQALNSVMSKTDEPSSIVVISHVNHDAEALAFHDYRFSRRGDAIIYI
ncbi:MAG: DUF58 domain-containing protein [Dehalococcoidales bacterium]|nr:DUF58 domain-containing protein [Dehalococcoidales bacterium]